MNRRIKHALNCRDHDAVFSACGLYRYVLTRRLGPGDATATFVMLNPSTADAVRDDPTIRRCIGFARQWRCDKLTVLNLFAFRATKPTALKRAADPVGPQNRAWFDRMLGGTSNGKVVCGWGVHGVFCNQDLAVINWLNELQIKPLALGLTREGYPRHPLYALGSVEPVSFVGRTTLAKGKFLI